MFANGLGQSNVTCSSIRLFTLLPLNLENPPVLKIYVSEMVFFSIFFIRNCASKKVKNLVVLDKSR